MIPGAALLTLPVSELLALWTELEEARHGTNGFGGHTAEIYCYRFQQRSPAREAGLPSALRFAADEDLAAARVFAAVLELFAETHPGIRLEVDGRAFGPWVAETPNPHRWHVRVNGERR